MGLEPEITKKASYSGAEPNPEVKVVPFSDVSRYGASVSFCTIRLPTLQSDGKTIETVGLSTDRIIQARRILAINKSRKYLSPSGSKRIAHFLWRNPVSRFCRSLSWNVCKHAVQGTKNLVNFAWNNPLSKCVRSVAGLFTRAVFRVTVVPLSIALWNRATAPLARMAWRAAGVLFDLGLNNREMLRRSRVVRTCTSLARGLYKAFWNNIFARGVISTVRKLGIVVSAGLFLTMEGWLPPYPLRAASYVKSALGAKLAKYAYCGTYLAALGYSVTALALGAGAGIPSLVAFFIAPGAAALANRMVMFGFSKGDRSKPGLRGALRWVTSKVNAPFDAMFADEDAFRFETTRDSKGALNGFRICPLPSASRSFLITQLQNHFNCKGAEGLADVALSHARELQYVQGPEKRIKRRDVIELAKTLHNQVELSDPPPMFYSNGELTINGYNCLREALIELNPAGYRELKSGKKREKYLNKLTHTMGQQIRERSDKPHQTVSLTNSFRHELHSKLVSADVDTEQTDCYRVPRLTRRNFRPTPSELLIACGRIIGGWPFPVVGSTFGAVLSAAGYLLNATGKILFSRDELGLHLNFEGLKEIKADFDQRMASAKTAENALTQFVGGLRKINNTLWRASDPFAREFGRAAVEAIIAHTPMIAQNEMDAMTGKTESEFLALEELVSYNGQIGEYSPDRRDELLNKVDRFWEDFGDMLLASDYGAGPSDRKPHLLLAAVVNNPMRLIRALRTALSQTGSKDVEAQELLEGFRLFFQERASKGLGSFFKAIDDRLAAAQLWIEEQYEGASESMAAVS